VIYIQDKALFDRLRGIFLRLSTPNACTLQRNGVGRFLLHASFNNVNFSPKLLTQF